MLRINILVGFSAILILQCTPGTLFSSLGPAWALKTANPASCKTIYNKKKAILDAKTKQARGEIEKSFAEKEKPLKKAYDGVSSEYKKKYGDSLDFGEAAWENCERLFKTQERIRKDIQMYLKMNIDAARRGSSTNYDNKINKLRKEVDTLEQQRLNCVKEAKAKDKKSGSFSDKQRKVSKAKKRVSRAMEALFKLEEEKRKKLEALENRYEREEEWLKQQLDYCEKNNKWAVDKPSVITPGCNCRLRPITQSLLKNLQASAKIDGNLDKMQVKLSRQWDDVSYEIKNNVNKAEVFGDILTRDVAFNFLKDFALDRLDDLIGSYFVTDKAVTSGTRVVQVGVGTAVRKVVQKVGIAVIKKIPGKSNAIIDAHQRLGKPEPTGNNQIEAEKMLKRTPEAIKQALRGGSPVLVTGYILGPNQKRVKPLQLEKFKKGFPSLVVLENTYQKIFALFKESRDAEAERNRLWSVFEKAFFCIKPPCDLTQEVSKYNRFGAGKEHLAQAKKLAFGNRPNAYWKDDARVKDSDIVTGLFCDLCKAFEALKDLKQASDNARDNIKVLNDTIINNMKTLINLNLDLYRHLTRPGPLEGALWGYYDYLAAAMGFLPNGGAAVSVAESAATVTDKYYVKDGATRDLRDDIKLVSHFQEINAKLTDKWTVYAKDLNRRQIRILRRIIDNCLEKIYTDEKTTLKDFSGTWQGDDGNAYTIKTGKENYFELIQEMAGEKPRAYRGKTDANHSTPVRITFKPTGVGFSQGLPQKVQQQLLSRHYTYKGNVYLKSGSKSCWPEIKIVFIKDNVVWDEESYQVKQIKYGKRKVEVTLRKGSQDVKPASDEVMKRPPDDIKFDDIKVVDPIIEKEVPVPPELNRRK